MLNEGPSGSPSLPRYENHLLVWFMEASGGGQGETGEGGIDKE